MSAPLNLHAIAESAVTQLDLVAHDLEWEGDKTGSAAWLRTIGAGLHAALSAPPAEPRHELDVAVLQAQIGGAL